jgi:hypothetical protein
MYDWDNISDQRKQEVLGFIYFNRCGDDDWEEYNSLYDENDNLLCKTEKEET